FKVIYSGGHGGRLPDYDVLLSCGTDVGVFTFYCACDAVNQLFLCKDTPLCCKEAAGGKPGDPQGGGSLQRTDCDQGIYPGKKQPERHGGGCRGAGQDLKESRLYDECCQPVYPYGQPSGAGGDCRVCRKAFAGRRAERGRVPGLFPVRVPGIGASDRGGIYDQFAAVFHSVRGADLSAAGRRGDPEGSITSGGSSECRRICGVLPCEIWVYERAYSDG